MVFIIGVLTITAGNYSTLTDMISPPPDGTIHSPIPQTSTIYCLRVFIMTLVQSWLHCTYMILKTNGQGTLPAPTVPIATTATVRCGTT